MQHITKHCPASMTCFVVYVWIENINTITVYPISISELMFQVLWTVIWHIVTSNYLYATSIECMENIENASLLTYFQFNSFMMVIAITPFKKRKKKKYIFILNSYRLKSFAILLNSHKCYKNKISKCYINRKVKPFFEKEWRYAKNTTLP